MRSSWSTMAGCMLLMLAVTLGAVFLFAAVFSGMLFFGSP
jgi:uncharacterized membrane protein